MNRQPGKLRQLLPLQFQVQIYHHRCTVLIGAVEINCGIEEIRWDITIHYKHAVNTD